MARSKRFYCVNCRVLAFRREDLDSPNMYECPSCGDLFYANYCHHCGSEVNSQYCNRCPVCEWAICANCGACEYECAAFVAEIDAEEEIFSTDEMVACLAEMDPDSEEVRMIESRQYYDDMSSALQDSFEEQQMILSEGLEYAEACVSDDEWLG